VPVAHGGRDHHGVARVQLLHGLAVALHPPGAGQAVATFSLLLSGQKCWTCSGSKKASKNFSHRCTQMHADAPSGFKDRGQIGESQGETCRN
jgi:hypothetical protein